MCAAVVYIFALLTNITPQQNQSVAWLTPLGLPAIQPYRGVAKYTVKTVLQTISLAVDDEFLPVSVRKQKSAFPPNFVHSLDATHMLMTALRMKSRQLAFASVHDSYWTHASDVEEMNTVIVLLVFECTIIYFQLFYVFLLGAT